MSKHDRFAGPITQAARLLEVLRDEFDATVPDDISEGAVGDSVLGMVNEICSDIAEGHDTTSISTGRVKVEPEWDDGKLYGFSVAVEVH